MRLMLKLKMKKRENKDGAGLKIVKVCLGEERSYKIFIGYNVLDKIGWYARRETKIKDEIVIVTNPIIKKLYLDRCKYGFEKAGFNTNVIVVPDGEKYKNINEAINIYRKLLKFKADRYVTLVALGGGVIGDLVGFVAATYLRGVNFIQVPTSLLAQVDSSVGGKVGVNLPEGKNLVGAFYQPKMVYIDCAVLSTLPQSEIRTGMAEVIKYGIIKNAQFFEFIENNLDDILDLKKECLEHIIATSCSIKAEIVSKDEKEKGERAILNFGHTIGHALETYTEYTKYKHGEAVAIGMVGAMLLAEKYSMITEYDVERVRNILIRTGLPVKMNDRIQPSTLIQKMKLDKKVANRTIRFVLTRKIGCVTVKFVTDTAILKSVILELQ